MIARRTWGLALMLVLAVATYCPAGPLTSGPIWRWTSWSPQTGVQPMGASVSGSGGAPAYVLRADATGTAELPSSPLIVAPPRDVVPPAPVVAFQQTTPTYSPPVNAWTLRPDALASLSAPSYQADAYINLGGGPYPDASMLTTGVGQPWYLSPVAQKVFGGIPDTQQRLAFSQHVLDQVQSAYQRAGLSVSLTDKSAISAAHTLSLVSGTHNPTNPEVVGASTVGQNSFTFIDNFNSAGSVRELETAVANNIAHELMHAFGVAREDASGSYIDSGVADWATVINPNAVFSGEAIRELALKDFRQPSDSSFYRFQSVAPVPEPPAWLGWGALVGAAACWRHRVKARTA